MTQRIIICILFLVTVSPVFNRASAGRHSVKIVTEMHSGGSQVPSDLKPESKLPMFPAPKEEAPHGKAAKVPHMEEVPHIHRYHKERVKKIRRHHSRIWILGKALIVICNLSLLWIAYMHLTH